MAELPWTREESPQFPLPGIPATRSPGEHRRPQEEVFGTWEALPGNHASEQGSMLETSLSMKDERSRQSDTLALAYVLSFSIFTNITESF